MKEGWEIKKLGEVCFTIADGDWIEKKDQSGSGIRLIQTGNIGVGEFKAKEDSLRFISEETFGRLKCTEIFPGDCLVSRLPEPVGRACLIPELGIRMITAVDCSILRFHESLNPRWFVYYSQSYEYNSDVTSQCTGTTRLRISRKNLSNIEIPVPPMDEQLRIVKILDDAFAKIDKLKANAQKNLANAKALFQATLKKELTPKPDWQTKKLGEVCEYVKEQGLYTNLPYVGMEDIEPNTNRYLGTLSPKTVKSTTFKFSEGFVLFGRLRPYLRKVLTPKFEGHCSTEIFPIKPSKELNCDFLRYWFLENIEMINSTCTGARMPRANMNEVLKFQISFPSIKEQKFIVSKNENLAKSTNNVVSNCEKTIAECDALKQSILRKAFNGEL